MLDDLAYYLADPLVQNAIKAVKQREGRTEAPDATGAVGKAPFSEQIAPVRRGFIFEGDDHE